MASKFQSKVKSVMIKKGYTVLNIIRLSSSGYPDLLCIKKGFPDLWIECKEGKDFLKPLQELRINELNNLGKIAICIHDSKGVLYPENYPNPIL